MRNYSHPTVVVLILGFFLVSPLCSGQDASNPFELQHRLHVASNENPFEIQGAKEKVADATGNPFEVKTSDRKNAVSTENPFEIQRTTTQTKPPVKQNIQEEKESNMPASTNTERPAFLFWLVIFLVLFFSVLMMVFRGELGNIYRAFTNENFMKLLHRQGSGFIYPAHVLYYIFFFFNAALFLHLASHRLLGVPALQLPVYLMILICIILLLAGKQVLLYILGGIFPFRKTVYRYGFMITIFSLVLGLLLFPLNVLIAYTSPFISMVVVVIGIIIVGCVYGYRFLRGIFLSRKYLSLYKFHFFMYLCAVEVAPLAIIIKLVTRNL